MAGTRAGQAWSLTLAYVCSNQDNEPVFATADNSFLTGLQLMVRRALYVTFQDEL